MSSSDEEVASPQLGASSSKDPVTPLESESDDDDVVIKKSRKNKRPRDASCSKDRQPVTPDASESDEDSSSLVSLLFTGIDTTLRAALVTLIALYGLLL